MKRKQGRWWYREAIMYVLKLMVFRERK